MKWDRFLFKDVDITNLVLFRVVFGALIATEAFGAITKGWLKIVLLEPKFTFNFIGFEFIQPLTDPLMYGYFALMGTFGLLIMVGYKYRFSMCCYALMWTCFYLMQKTTYNNHYYLLMLLCWIMVFLPAHRWLSVDARQYPKIKSPSMPQWCLWVLILQVWIVYSFASIAKIYPDWLDASLPAHLMKPKANYYLIGNLLQQSWLHYGMAYVGIAFDLLIVPLMLWKRTRLVGFGISIFFHLFNSFVFHIGIFPYMSISFALFFFTAETLQKRFIPSSLRPNFKEKLKTDESTFDRNAKVFVPTYRNILVAVLGIYFLFQLALPLRHWFFKDDVLWTEEGHRLSWRMMLRAKNGHLTVWTTDKKTFIRTKYNYHALLTQKQQRAVTTKPDMLWQLAQRIKKIEAAKGKDVAVYMNSEVSVNGSSYYPFIDPKVDIAAEEWHPFKHSEWILASPKELK